MKTRLLTAAAVSLLVAGPVSADPTIGFGVSFSFGGGASATGLGLRLFSDNERNKVAATVGVDYMLNTRRVRPTVGVAYMGRNNYVGVDLGFGLNGEGVDFGVGLGGVRTKRPAPVVVATPPVVAAGPTS